MAELFLGKFPIEHLHDLESQRIYVLSDETGKYKTNLSVIAFPTEVQISAAMNHDSIDDKLVPRLLFHRDLYNAVHSKLVEKGLQSRMENSRVLPPRFHLALTYEASIKGKTFEEDKAGYIKGYTDMITLLSAIYGIEGVRVEEDFLHDEKAVLTPFPHYRIELAKPVNSHFVNFHATADADTDYKMLKGISINIYSSAVVCLKHVLNFYDQNDSNTECNFNIDVDLRKDRLLPDVSDIRALLN
jgi:hypothetical protein